MLHKKSSKKRNQRTTEVKCLSKSNSTEKLPKTPLYIAIDKKAYRSGRQKAPIRKTTPNTAKKSLPIGSRTEVLVNRYPAKLPSKTLARVCFREKTVLKFS